MNANKLAQQSNYFQNGYHNGADGWRATPTGQEGSAAWEYYMEGYAEGKKDGNH